MEQIVRPGVFTPDITLYFGCRAIEPTQPTIRRIDASDPMGRPSIQAPPLAESLNIDTYGLYILLHGQPGSTSAVSRVLMDFAYCVNCQTVFGLALARLLNSIERGTQPVYHRRFACMMALPHRYHEAIMEFDQRNALSPFRPQEGLTFHLSRPHIEAHQIANLGLQDIINVLLDNRIPPSWVDHSYLFGLAYLNAHYVGNSPHQALYDDIDNE